MSIYHFSIRKLATATICTGLIGLTSLYSASNTLNLKDKMAGYSGTEDFYTNQSDSGAFNSKSDLDNQTLRVAPLELDTKSVLRFGDLPLSQSSYGAVERLAVVLTFKSAPSADTIMLHNLNSTDMWNELTANYNTINGAAPWSGGGGKLIDAWANTDGLAIVTGNEEVNSQLIIEIHPSDASARKTVLDSWLDGDNQGVVIRGISGVNEFFSSDAYNIANRPELIIKFSSY